MEDYRVVLTKEAPRMSLPAEAGRMRVTLNWNAAGPTPIDLDLCCLWEFADGSRGCVQAFGGKFNAPRNAAVPVIAHDGDERRGGPEGESMTIDMSQVELIRRILVFAYIYDGAPNWAAADGVVTVYPVSGPPVEVNLDESDPRARVCAMFLLRNVGGELRIRREVRYFTRGHRAMDAAYDWGLTWRRGRK
jgi:tellurite resistance protein TerA